MNYVVRIQIIVFRKNIGKFKCKYQVKIKKSYFVVIFLKDLVYQNFIFNNIVIFIFFFSLENILDYLIHNNNNIPI